MDAHADLERFWAGFDGAVARDGEDRVREELDALTHPEETPR